MRRFALAVAACALIAGPALADPRSPGSSDTVYFWEDASRPGAGFGWSDQPQPSRFGSVRPRNIRQACELSVGRTMRRDNSGQTYSSLMVDACVRRGGALAVVD